MNSSFEFRNPTGHSNMAFGKECESVTHIWNCVYRPNRTESYPFTNKLLQQRVLNIALIPADYSALRSDTGKAALSTCEMRVENLRFVYFSILVPRWHYTNILISLARSSKLTLFVEIGSQDEIMERLASEIFSADVDGPETCERSFRVDIDKAHLAFAREQCV